MPKKYFDDATSDGYVLAMQKAILDKTGLTAATADTVFFTTTNAGLYLINASICVTTVGSGSGNTIQALLKAKDESGTSQSFSGTALSGLAVGSAGVSNVNVVAYLPANTTISYSEVDGGTQTTHAVYNMHMAVSQLS